MGPDGGTQTYIRDLEEHLRRAVFDGVSPIRSDAAVLLVRGALAGGDHTRAVRLAQATQDLADEKQDNSDMTAAAKHARGLIDRDSVTLECAASKYSSPVARACATEDAGQALSAHGDHGCAAARLREAYDQYEQAGCAEDMARVRSQLRACGVTVHHWKRADRPAFGWASLTDTERRIADLVAQGLSNRQVAGRVFLSSHTVAFHLRHIFWKLDVCSRVQLARLVAEHQPEQASEKASSGRGSVGIAS
ncbi:MAG: helix-turn-helix transcriptional regulator [Streptosporangiaceae bacterium]|jgi:DNA-binding CsgD family transcriptional regulator